MVVLSFEQQRVNVVANGKRQIGVRKGSFQAFFRKGEAGIVAV